MRDEPPVPSIRDAVMLLEDDLSLRDLLCALCEMEGWEALAAERLAEAVSLLRTRAVGAIVADAVESPPDRMDLSFIHRLREVSPDVPIILLTAHQGVKSVDLEAWGLHAALGKPFDLEALITIVRRALRDSA